MRMISWSVGERIQLLLSDNNLPVCAHFSLSTSINTITTLVGQILVKAQESRENGTLTEFYIFHNQLKEYTGYVALC